MEANLGKQTGRSVSPDYGKWSDIEVAGSNASWSDLLKGWVSAKNCNLAIVALLLIAILIRPDEMVLTAIVIGIVIIALAELFLDRRQNAESIE